MRDVIQGIQFFLQTKLLKEMVMFSHFSHVQLFVSLWTVAHQAPLSIGFYR